VPGCPCLDDGAPAANDPAWGDLAGASGPPLTAHRPEERVVYELAPLGCLAVVLLIGGCVVVWAVWQGVQAVRRALGVGP
jgi:hypothetical protein